MYLNISYAEPRPSKSGTVLVEEGCRVFARLAGIMEILIRKGYGLLMARRGNLQEMS
ncbi:MAG: hypothetical protein R3B74_04980 [Nitrospirales bacterium]|nr:hypothetical protein [Nitrospirales bacterium]